jgi:hypothetical protein
MIIPSQTRYKKYKIGYRSKQDKNIILLILSLYISYTQKGLNSQLPTALSKVVAFVFKKWTRG